MLDEKKIYDVLSSPLVAGAVGVAISIAWHKPTINDAIIYVLSGVFGAVYGSRPFVEWQGLTESWVPIVAMVIGVFAGSVFANILNFIHSGRAADLFYNVIMRRNSPRIHDEIDPPDVEK